MEPEIFDKLYNQIVNRNRKTASGKSKEYASDSDKLYNFKRSGERRQKTPEEALMGMAEKHFNSIEEIVSKIEKENQKVGLLAIVRPKFLTKKILEEKIGDAMIYYALLEGLIKERYGWL